MRLCRVLDLTWNQSNGRHIARLLGRFPVNEGGFCVTITKDMGIGEVVQKYPATVPVFMSAGMGCIGCAASHFENIEQGALAHGIDIDALMKGLNEAVAAN